MQDLVPLWFKPCINFTMIPHKKVHNQLSFFSAFEDTLSQKHPLYILANKIRWHIFEDAFLPLYCQDNGRSAKPIRLMVGLLILSMLEIFQMNCETFISTIKK